MKPKRNPPKQARREIFVLTPEEKKALCFVLIAVVLGLATKHYRATHPPPLPKAEISVREKASPHRQTRIQKHEPSSQ